MKTLKLFILDFTQPAFLAMSMTLGLLKTFVNTYVFSDWPFAASLFVLVAFDTVLGTIRAIRRKEFEIKKIGSFLEKIVLYCGVLAVGHVLVHHQIDNTTAGNYAYVRNALYSGMMFREGLSILKSFAEKYPGAFSNLLKFFKGYDEKGAPEKSQ